MKSLLEFSEARKIDLSAIRDFGISEEILMENVGRSAWIFLQRLLKSDSRVTYVIGGGNNGADGLVMARHQHYAGLMPIVVLAGNCHNSSVQRQMRICQQSGIPLISQEKAPTPGPDDWIVDAITGIGLKGSLRKDTEKIVEWMNHTPARICALDVPSGAREGYEKHEPIVQATVTLAAGAPKSICYQPLLRLYSGDIHRIYGSFPPSLFASHSQQVLLEEEDIHAFVHLPSSTSYKSTRGVLAVFAGSVSFPGAMLLCVRAAQNSLCGLVNVIDDEYPPALLHAPEATWIRKFSPSRYQAALVGPGWGMEEPRRTQLRELLKGDLPLVLDADALNLLADESVSRSAELVLTPHPLEAARLAGTSTEEILHNPWISVRELAKRYQAVVVLKGHVSCIADAQGRIAIVDGMQAVLATGGSGDVLAGIIAGLVASGHGAWEAACAGTLIHQKAGRLLQKERGWSTAGFLIEYIAKIFRQ